MKMQQIRDEKMESPLQQVPCTPLMHGGGHQDYTLRPSPLVAVVPELVWVQSQNESQDYLLPPCSDVPQVVCVPKKVNSYCTWAYDVADRLGPSSSKFCTFRSFHLMGGWNFLIWTSWKVSNAIVTDQVEDYLVPHTPKPRVQSSDRQWKIPSIPAKRFYSIPFVNSPYMGKRRCSKDSGLQEQVVPGTPKTPLTPSTPIKKNTYESNNSPYITTPKRQSVLNQRKTTQFTRSPLDCQSLDLFDNSDIFG